MTSAADLERLIREAVARATEDAWSVNRVFQEGSSLRLSFTPATLVLSIERASGGVRSYRELEGLAYSYRSDGELPREDLSPLDAVIEAVGPVLAAASFDPARDVLTAPPTEVTFPTPYHRAHLASEVDLDSSVIDTYRRDGHVLVRRALHRDVIESARPYLESKLEQVWPRDLLPVDQRPDAYSRSFTQITDLGLEDPALRVFSYSRRVLSMAAQLMGVSAVRLFCEDWLIKEPGALITPYHQDEAVFPFEAAATITCWIPLSDIGPADGLLRFARGAHRLGLAPIEDINDTSEEAFAAIIAEHGLDIDEMPPVFVGDVSFHDGKMIHGAFPNRGDMPRVALALHCYADGARVKEPTTPKMQRILESSAPHLSVQDLAESERWPLVYAADAHPARGLERAGRSYRLNAVPLPRREPRDLYVRAGTICDGLLEDAEELAAPGGFVTTGLFECHGHISYPHDRDAPVSTPAWMNARRLDYAQTGVTAIRDMGAVDDATSTLLDVPGLPRVHACGQMILRQDEWPFTRTEPADLVRACAERIERGGRWVKIFADFTSDYQGRINTGFTSDDAVTYPLPLLSEAVRVVHSLGGRVAAHCFTRPGTEVAIEAGVDSLEHGWGADASLVARMAGRGIAWAPLTAIAHPMWVIARRDEEPERVRWIEETMGRLSEALPAAEASGVVLLAGTDLFPSVTVADEIRQLNELGVSREAALAAGTWGARAFFGETDLDPGAPADLVLYRRDPRLDLSVLFEPELIFIGGERVEPSLVRVRQRYASWAERDHIQ